MCLFLLSFCDVLALGAKSEFSDYAKMIGLTATPDLLKKMIHTHVVLCKSGSAAYRAAHNREQVEGTNDSIVLEDLPVDAAASIQATSALGGLFVQPNRAAPTPPSDSAAQGQQPEAVAIDDASLHESTSRPPDSSK